jgi:hypothetical protein
MANGGVRRKNEKNRAVWRAADISALRCGRGWRGRRRRLAWWRRYQARRRFQQTAIGGMYQ